LPTRFLLPASSMLEVLVMGDPDFSNPFSDFHASAAALREMFETYVSVGFTEEQSLQICLAQLSIVARLGEGWSGE
jgi:hypothetical protein